MPTGKQVLLVQLSTNVDSTVDIPHLFRSWSCLLVFSVVTHLSCSLSFFCGFPKLMGFEMSFKVLNPSSPLCFWTDVSGCFIISIPWHLGGSVQRLDLRYGFFRAASVVVFCHCLLPWFLLLLLAVPVLLWFFFFLLPSPSMLTFHTLALFANCGTTYAHASLSHSYPPPPPLQWRHIC